MSFWEKHKHLFIKAAAFSTALLLCCSYFSSCARSSHSPDSSPSNIIPTSQGQILSSASPPAVSAKAAILMDGDSGAVLYSKNPDQRLPMASTTKIMTALVAIEQGDLSSEVEIPKEAVGVEGSSIYLYVGERLTLEQLVYAVLLESANDAATAVAIAVGGSVESFAEMMNQKAEDLGLKNTHFENPHGLDSDNHYTTARELGIIASAAIKNEKFREISSTYKKTIPLNDTEGVRLLINHNKLLKGYQGAIGVKTGYTKKSGRCLVSAAERDGLTLICVTLSAPDDWRDHKALLDHGFFNYESKVLCAEGEIKYTLPIVGGRSEYLTLTNQSEIRLTLPRTATDIEYRIECPRFEFAPLSEGNTLGRIVYTLDGEEVASSPLVASYNVERKTDRKKFREWLTSLFDK